MTTECEGCRNRFNSLTKEGLCAFCHLKKYNKWAPKFTNGGPKKANGEE